jgi:hypothetical protein
VDEPLVILEERGWGVPGVADGQVEDGVRVGIQEAELISKTFLAALSFIVQDTRRDGDYISNHLLSYTAQDYLQSALSLPLLVREGI